MSSPRPSAWPLTQHGPFRLYSTEELLKMPPPTWLVEPIMPLGGLVALYGRPGSKKSFVALDLALSVASGQSWLGTHAVQSGYVIYISAEGGTGIGKRVLAWLTARNLKAKDLQIAWLIESIPIYADSEQMQTLLTRIEEEVQEQPTLVVVDTLARCFDGDENQQEDMGRFIAGVDTIRHTFGATVLIVHHTRLDGERERGNTAFRGAADTMIAQESEDGDPAIVLECKKQKDAEHFDPIALKLATVSQTDSCVILSPEAELVTLIKDALKQAQKPLSPKDLRKVLISVNISQSTLARRLRDMVESKELLNENGEYTLGRVR